MKDLLYLVTSDIHGEKEALRSLLRIYGERIQGIIFAGDGLDLLRDEGKNFYEFHAVKGNCDSDSFESAEKNFLAGPLHIFLTHGHLFQVKSGLSRLVQQSRKRGWDLVIFGHTHRPCSEKIENTLFFNPGALVDGYYSLLHIQGEDFYLEHKFCPEKAGFCYSCQHRSQLSGFAEKKILLEINQSKLESFFHPV